MELIGWIVSLLPASVHAQKIISGALEAIIISRFVAGIVFPFAALLFELVMHAPRDIVRDQVPFTVDFQSGELHKVDTPFHGIAIGARGVKDSPGGRIASQEFPDVRSRIRIVVLVENPGIVIACNQQISKGNVASAARTAIAIGHAGKVEKIAMKRGIPWKSDS